MMTHTRRSCGALSAAFAAALLALLMSSGAAPLAGGQAAARPAKLALVGGMLLDGYEAPPIHRAAILIDGDRIVRVAPAAEITIPPDYTVVDTIPGAPISGPNFGIRLFARNEPTR